MAHQINNEHTYSELEVLIILQNFGKDHGQTNGLRIKKWLEKWVADHPYKKLLPQPEKNMLTNIELGIAQKNIAVLIDLVKALEKYQTLLSDECTDLAGMATVHGWKSTRVEQGIQCRKEIEDLKFLLSDNIISDL